MTQVVWPNANSEVNPFGSWDQEIVRELVAGIEAQRWPHPGSLAYRLACGKADPNAFADEYERGAVIVIAGQHNRFPEMAEQMAELVESYAWSLTIITSDEEALFPVEILPTGPNRALWGQYHARPEFDRVIPIGLPPHTRETLAKIEAERPARMGDVYFAGQNTHARRDELLSVMKDMACDPIKYGNLAWLGTSGFRAGVDQERYLRGLRDARIAPCPSGYHSLDSFRLYEALAAGCIPIVEQYTPDGHEPRFWPALFGDDCPIPRVESWTILPELFATFGKASAWYDLRNQIRDWYADYRASLAADFASTIARLQS